MLVQTPVAQTKQELTVVEIDGFLVGIVNALKNGKDPDKELAFKRCDKWLDLRLKVVNKTNG